MDYKVFGLEIIVMFNCVVVGVLVFCWIVVYNIGGLVIIFFFYGFFFGVVMILLVFIIFYFSLLLVVIGIRMGIVYGVVGFGVLIGVLVVFVLDVVVKDYDGDEFLGV